MVGVSGVTFWMPCSLNKAKVDGAVSVERDGMVKPCNKQAQQALVAWLYFWGVLRSNT